MALRLVGKDIMLGDDTMTKAGDQNANVTLIQTVLSKNGYPTGGIDGIFGEKTRQAVIAFQSAQGLQADGIVGPLTWNAIQKLSAVSPIPVAFPAQPVVNVPAKLPAVIAQPATPWSAYMPYVFLFGLIYLVVNGKK